jgi:8-oxo-dGTP pyrophosphatase MutT (NUDIX family)
MMDQLFYVGQKAFIEKNGEILILKHEKGLDFPGGKIKENELDFIGELKREVLEETRLEIEVDEPFVVWHTKFPKNGHFIYLVGFRCRYISGEIKLSDEHLGYEWVNIQNYESLDDGETYFGALKKYFTQTDF